MLTTTLALLPLLVPAVSGETSPALRAERPWTLLVYGGADNNADGPILAFLDDVRKAIDDDPGIEVLLLIDRSTGYSDDATLLGEDFTGTRLYRLHRDSAERLAGGTELPEITLDEDVECDSGDADLLRRFIAWGKRTAPAQRTGLLVYSHADGRSMCPDDESGGEMGIAELSDVAGEAESLDFLALELCNMGGIEIAYQWRPAPGRFGADVLVAIPNAGPPLDWDRAFRRIRTPGHALPPEADGEAVDPAAMTAEAFGRLVIEEGRRGRLAAEERGRPAEHEAAGCYDLRAAASVKQALDALARELGRDETREDNRTYLLEMRGPGPIGDAINYTRGGPFVDLYDLSARVEGCDAFDDAVREAATGVLDALERFVVASFGMQAYEGFESGRHGVFVVLPRDGEGVWRDFRWYTPLRGERGPDYGHWAFLKDGATPGDGVVDNWFELLDAWFDPELEGGGVNDYRW